MQFMKSYKLYGENLEAWNHENEGKVIILLVLPAQREFEFEAESSYELSHMYVSRL